jgi:hypothetical protein
MCLNAECFANYLTQLLCSGDPSIGEAPAIAIESLQNVRDLTGSDRNDLARRRLR